MNDVLPLDFWARLAGLNFFVYPYCNLSDFFLFAGLLTWLLGLVCVDFFLPFCTIYLHLDLLYIMSPQDRLYFFLFSAIINFKTDSSSSSDLLFHFLWLCEAPLARLIFGWASSMARVFLLLVTFLSLSLSLQMKFISTFSRDLDKLPLTSEAINDECGLTTMRFAKDAFYFQSFNIPQGSWPG